MTTVFPLSNSLKRQVTADVISWTEGRGSKDTTTLHCGPGMVSIPEITSRIMVTMDIKEGRPGFMLKLLYFVFFVDCSYP